jgi:hypothetical protein
MKNDSVEFVVDGLEAIALIIRAEFDEPGISFFTPDSFSQQVAYMKHPKGKTIEPHVHNLITRQVQYTQEVLFVKMGALKIDLYSSKRKFISSHVLNGGDAVLLCGGGHSFQMLEETSFIEVKQGPYAGDNDKVRFEGGK